MSVVVGPNGNETKIRAVVFREGELYVAQCLEYDISAQAADIDTLLERLDLTVEAEFKACEQNGVMPRDCIQPAPNYYHEMWGRRSFALHRVDVATPSGRQSIDVAYAKAA